MSDLFLEAIIVSEKLLETRSSKLENCLGKLLRSLSSLEKLEILVKVMMVNARLAATLACRANLPVEYQMVLLKLVMTHGGVNLIRYMVSVFFSKRIKGKTFVRCMNEFKVDKPEKVSVAIYYFLNEGFLSMSIKARLQEIDMEVRNKLAISSGESSR